MRHQATNEILQCVELGMDVVLLRGCHHRKLAIIDRKIIWEGSLNILSYANSREIMRRIENKNAANQMFKFLKLGKLIFYLSKGSLTLIFNALAILSTISTLGVTSPLSTRA